MNRNVLPVGVGIILVAVVISDRLSHRRELDSLRATVSRLEQTRTPAEATPPSAMFAWSSRAPQIAADTNAATAPVAKPAASPIESYAPVHDAMEAAFVSEPTDASWSRDARRTMENGVAAHLPEGSRITSVDCRSTLCRVEMTHDNYRRAKEFANGAFASPEGRPWNGAYTSGPVAKDERTGQITFVAYLTREGAELPPFGQD
jgi:hypothetical protein